MSPQCPPSSYKQAYFPLSVAELSKISQPFDIVIIGSGIGGGVLAADLIEKNKRLSGSSSYNPTQSTPQHTNAPQPTDESLRILVIERGGLTFNTHCLNGPRPTSLGEYGQMNDAFFQQFKDRTTWTVKLDPKTVPNGWAGGPVYTLGGRSTVWGLFVPRIANSTLEKQFPADVVKDLTDVYYRRAEERMDLSYPETLPLHQAIIDRLNRIDGQATSSLPATQWEWGRVASQFRDPKNFDFADGAYSTTDKLLEAAMNDPRAERKFGSVLEAKALRLEPQPRPGQPQKDVTHVVVESDGKEYKIPCKTAVVCAGSVESASILLRSVHASNADGLGEYAKQFGHVTDHHIVSVSMPFAYKNPVDKEILGGMKLQTDITFDKLDGSSALVNISLDSSSFLPRSDEADPNFPELIIAYILPTELAQYNSVTLDEHGKPVVKFGYAEDKYLEQKKRILLEIAVDIMNKITAEVDVVFLNKQKGNYLPLDTVTLKDISLQELGGGGVAHEMGTIPMPGASGHDGLVDSNLKLKFGWNNVYVCDLSVFPYSAAANPSLSLAALSLRLSDHLSSKKVPQPIIVYNFLQTTVYVRMTLSKGDKSFGPSGTEVVKLDPGESKLFGRVRKEALFVYRSGDATDSFDAQAACPGVNAFVVNTPPK